MANGCTFMDDKDSSFFEFDDMFLWIISCSFNHLDAFFYNYIGVFLEQRVLWVEVDEKTEGGLEINVAAVTSYGGGLMEGKIVRLTPNGFDVIFRHL